MVTLQEVEARIKNLNEIESQARSTLAQDIPQRRFGSRVTTVQQQQIIQNKTEANKTINQIESEKNQLENTKAELLKQESYNQDYKVAERVAFSNNPSAVFALQNKRQREIYREILSGIKSHDERLASKQKEGEVYINGQGYSVAPAKQPQFIQQQVSNYYSSFIPQDSVGQSTSEGIVISKVINTPETNTNNVRSDSFGRFNSGPINNSSALSSSPSQKEETTVYERRLVFEKIPGTNIYNPLPRLKGEYIASNETKKDASTFTGSFLGRMTESLLETGPQQFYTALEIRRKEQPISENKDIKLGILYGLMGAAATGSKVIRLGLSSYMAYQATKATKKFISNPSGENLADVSINALGSYPLVEPIVSKGVSNIPVLTNKNILYAELKGDMVPIMDRYARAEDLLNNPGGKMNVATANNRLRRRPLWNEKNPSNPDYTHNVPIEFATPEVAGNIITSDLFLKTNNLGRKGIRPSISIEEGLIQSNIPENIKLDIKESILSGNPLEESKIKQIYDLASLEAEQTGRPIITFTPKRLRGFPQSELEVAKVFPSNYKVNLSKFRFGGFAEDLTVIFRDKSTLNSLKLNYQSWTKNTRYNYWERLASEKQSYLEGRPSWVGEYETHGREHLNPMDIQNIYYKGHDITKPSDYSEIKGFPHGETAGELLKTGKYPDKTIYKNYGPTDIKLMAEAYAGHEYARFNLKSLFVKPKWIGSDASGWKVVYKLSLPSRQNVFWYVKQKVSPNPFLEDIATLDRADLRRYGIIPHEMYMSKDALKRLYGKNGQSHSEIINEMKNEVIKEGKINKPISQDISKIYGKEYSYIKEPKAYFVYYQDQLKYNVPKSYSTDYTKAYELKSVAKYSYADSYKITYAPSSYEKSKANYSSNYKSSYNVRTKYPSSMPKYTSVSSKKKITNSSFKVNNRKPYSENLMEQIGYRTFIKKKGKKVYLAGIRAKGEAILFGEEVALQGTQATFGVEKAGTSVIGGRKSFTPSNKLFRTYRIKKGERLALTDTFIQRKGKRLITRDEVKALQLARYR